MGTRSWRVGTRAGHRLHVRTHEPDAAATAPDFLLVHGLASNALLWDGVGAALAAAGHRAVAVDQRGHGHSEQAAAGPVRQGLLDDLVDVTTALGLHRPVAVGQSWGGNVVLDLAAGRPGLLAGVACVDGGFLDLQARFEDEASMRTALTPPPLDGLTFDDVEQRLRAATDGWPEAGTEGQLGNLVVQHDRTVTPALRRPEHHRILDLLWERRPVDVAPSVDVPVLLLPATEDGTPPEDGTTARDVARLAAALSHCTVHWALGAHHDVHAQRPEEVVRVLLDTFAPSV